MDPDDLREAIMKGISMDARTAELRQIRRILTIAIQRLGGELKIQDRELDAHDDLWVSVDPLTGDIVMWTDKPPKYRTPGWDGVTRQAPPKPTFTGYTSIHHLKTGDNR